MAAKLEQVDLAGGEPRMEIEVGERAARPLPYPFRLIDRDQYGRFLEMLGDATGHDADHTRVPVRIGQHQRSMVQPFGMCFHLFLSLLEHFAFNGLADLVLFVNIDSK